MAELKITAVALSFKKKKISLFFNPEMKRYLLLWWVLAFSVVTMAAGKPQRRRHYVSGNAEGAKPCRIQLIGSQLRCAMPAGYRVRSGDCPGNDIWALYRDHTTLTECARLCSTSSQCQAFMLYNNHRCFPKTKTCDTTSKANPLNVFYDKVPSSNTMRPGDKKQSQEEAGEEEVPSGYAMRLGDCPGNDIWSIHGFVSPTECARRCNNHHACVSFMFFDGHDCYPKTKTCQTTHTGNPKNFFYDKIVII